MKTERSNDFELVPYDLETATVETLKGKYLDLTIKPDDKADYGMVMGGLRECREIRLAVDQWHKDRKALINKAAKHYDQERRRVHGLIEPIETHLKEARKAEDDRKAAIEAEKARKEQEWVDGIKAKIEAIKAMATSIGTKTSDEIDGILAKLMGIDITEAEYQEFTEEARGAYEHTYATVSEAMTARVKWEQEQEEAKKEAERLAKIRAEQEAEAARLKAEQDRIAEENRKIQEEKDRIEREKREAEIAEKARKDALREAQERAEREDRERKEKEEREAREKKDREEAEAAEKARQEALRPDKERLIAFAVSLYEIPIPEVKAAEAKEILTQAINGLDKASRMIEKRAEML